MHRALDAQANASGQISLTQLLDPAASSQNQERRRVRQPQRRKVLRGCQFSCHLDLDLPRPETGFLDSGGDPGRIEAGTLFGVDDGAAPLEIYFNVTDAIQAP